MKNIIAADYGWATKNAEQSHSYLLPTSIKILKQFRGEFLLDIGTGNGSTLPYWLHAGYKVSAMEPDPAGYSFAKQHDQVDIRQIAIGDKLPDDWKLKFDAAVCLEVIEHLFDPAELIVALNFSLKKGGIVVVSTPYHGYAKNFALSIFNKWDFHHHPTRVGGHIKFWSEKTLSEFFTSNGFERLAWRGVGRVPFLWKSMIAVFKKID